MNSTGDKVITGLSFTPKLVRFTVLPGISSTNGTYGQGAMTDAAQFAASMTIDSSNNKSRYSSTANCISYSIATSSTPSVLANYVSMNVDGFTINVSIGGSINVAFEAYG